MISIIVPCYNCEKTFERCIMSIRNQTQSNIEIILVDDGSTDTTYQLCKDAASVDSRVKVIHQSNYGAGASRIVGIQKATGDYLAFCDSDDYIDTDMIEKLEDKLQMYKADIVAFGMKTEYENGSIELRNNRLVAGYYTLDDIRNTILPVYFCNGEMESNIIIHSIWTKLIRRSLLLPLLPLLDRSVTNGEDVMTVFASVLSANSIYCINNFFPYHYIRNSNSTIGRYDAQIMDKNIILRNALINIASKFQYGYMHQIEDLFLSSMLVNIKKEICRNNCGYKIIKKNLIHMRENPIFTNALQTCSIQNYEIKSKLFAKLVIKKRYHILYIITKVMNMLGNGKP